MTPATSSHNDAGGFSPTRWSLVLEARGDTPEARSALSELCGHYWRPVFEFLRREGRPEDDARELAQAFFARVLGSGGFGGADPGRGRFRSFLLGALRHFLADDRKRARRLKRGAGEPAVSLDVASEEEEPEAGAGIATEAPGDAVFDRAWALAIMDRALDTLQRESAAAGRERSFELLKPWIAGGTAERSQTEAAQELGLSDGAAKVAIHRLRKRFRERVRAEVLQTLGPGEDVETELRYLVEVLSGTPG